MNTTIALFLTQDGLTNGAIYALLALALVMVFSVTRVILVPQGDLVTYAAFTLASFKAGVLPGTLWLLTIGGLVVAAMDLYAYARGPRSAARLRSAALYALYPAAIVAALHAIDVGALPYLAQILLTLLAVVPFGPIMYRAVFQHVENASVLVLLIVAVAVHIAMLGLALFFFGPEGVRTTPIVTGRIAVAGVSISAQVIFVTAVSLVLVAALFWFFRTTIAGKALRATAFNRTGARLVGISTSSAGVMAFLLAGLIGTVSGILVAPITTIYYDTGFLIGLKGFIAAIVGGLVSYPLAAIGALGLGLMESFSAFVWSSYKDVIVFALIIPILIWRSLVDRHPVEDEEE